MGIFDFLKKKHAGPDEEVMPKPIATPENRQKGHAYSFRRS